MYLYHPAQVTKEKRVLEKKKELIKSCDVFCQNEFFVSAEK